MILPLLPSQQLGQLLILVKLTAGAGELIFQSGYLLLQLAQFSTGIFGDDKGLWLELLAPLAKKAVIPHRQVTTDLQPCQRLLVAGFELMHGLIARLAQPMKEIHDDGLQRQLTANQIEQLGLIGLGPNSNSTSSCNILGQGFAQLAQLDQGCVGITRKCPFCPLRELEQNGIMVLQEIEVAVLGHVHSSKK